jgi:arylsulfatase A-like enzyme
MAGLLKDLKNRGLLDETLVVFGGEFGRTVTRDKGGAGQSGRDHNGRGFSTVMAGGGVKGGTAYGATDEFGDRATLNRVHVHDLHATILALLGFDHQRLTYRYNGRDFRLTDNYGNVVQDVIA